MKPRIRAYTENYELWIGYAWLALSMNIENGVGNEPLVKYKFNTDVMEQTTTNPKTNTPIFVKKLW